MLTTGFRETTGSPGMVGGTPRPLCTQQSALLLVPIWGMGQTFLFMSPAGEALDGAVTPHPQHLQFDLIYSLTFQVKLPLLLYASAPGTPDSSSGGCTQPGGSLLADRGPGSGAVDICPWPSMSTSPPFQHPQSPPEVPSSASQNVHPTSHRHWIGWTCDLSGTNVTGSQEWSGYTVQ